MHDGAHSTTPGPVFWRELFGNVQPTYLEIGPGRGEFLLASAASHPERNFLAIERSRSRARLLEARIATAGLRNAHVINGDAGCVVDLIPDACVAAYVIQFPDPWWKRRHRSRRVVTADLVAAMARTLHPGGTIEVVTDVPEYFEHIQSLLDGHPELVRLAPTGSEATPITSFARKAGTRGSPLCRSTHHRRTN